MKKIISHTIYGLLIGVLLCSSLGIVQGSNSTLNQKIDPLAGIKVDQPLTSATSISAGNDHTCAVTTEGGVQCWGANYYGQLGDGTTDDRLTPVNVVGFTGEVVIAVSAGAGYTCALTSAGGVKCWGANYFGQLGDGTTVDRFTPVLVSGLDSIVVEEISVGAGHTCAVTSEGGVMCWGNNGSGQLGYDTTPDSFSSIPDFVGGFTDEVVIAISAGDNHTCAITSDKRVKCWGNNGDGQLGDWTRNSSIIPVTVKESLSEDLLALAVSLGEYHTCAITSTNVVKCWGYNSDGQLGDGTTDDSLIPVDVSGLTSEVKAISAGGSHNCALTMTGDLKCWGDNDYGKLGDTSTTDRHTPVLVTELSIGIKAVSAGAYHTCALSSGGAVKCWGKNDYGQLGDGTTTRLTTPVDVVGLSSGVGDVSANFQYTCALTEAGGVKCWGDKFNGLYDPIGEFDNTNSSIPVDMDGLTSGVKAISTGKYHTCAITAMNGVKCWGYNSDGQLGDGTYNNSLTPVDVGGFTGEEVIAVSAGDDHTCALTSEGVVKCWGSDNFSQLGDVADNIRSNIPVYVDGFDEAGEDAIAISAGAYHTCLITSGGGVKCWGDNQMGQLGTVTPFCDYFYCSKTPVDVDGLTSGMKAVSAGSNHTCAITENDGIKCWGYNEYGQLGDGTYVNIRLPVDVYGFTDDGEDASKISAGYQHTCAITLSGTLKCWGDNDYGQLGDGTTTRRRTPVDVVGLTSGMKAVSAGMYHTCALTSADGVKCWGENEHGQLGWRLLWVPIDVIGFVDNFKVYLPMIDR